MGTMYSIGNPHIMAPFRLGNRTKIDAKCPVSINRKLKIMVIQISFLYSFSFMDEAPCIMACDMPNQPQDVG